MAKIKNKKNKLTENKNKTSEKKLNPFEVHINKQKFQILGQKSKNDRGLPGISRAKAVKKRKNTLLPEFNLKNKNNQFLDRRIGEKNKGMTAEEKVIARFTAERIKIHKKKSIFNLGDDEILTHRGQTLNEIEKFDDPRSEDEFSDNENTENGRLDANFVEDAHFGGGVLSNTNREGAKSRKDLIEQLIAESKKRKAEKQKLREETIELTEKLDSDWKDLLPLVNTAKKNNIIEKPNVEDKNIDDYDKMMRELKFEARGNPTDRLKTEDEIAKEEKERLEKLEQDRIARMKGFVNNKEAQSKHRSADDLDDDFIIDPHLEDDHEKNIGETLENIDQIDSDTEDNNSKQSDSDIETASEDDLSDLKADESSSEEENDCEFDANILNTQKMICDTSTVDIEKKKLSNSQSVKSVNSKSFKITENNQKLKNDLVNEVSVKNVFPIELDKVHVTNEKIDHTENIILEDLLNRKKIMEEARNELPFTFNIPDKYEDFEELLSSKSLIHQVIVIERMIKCNHQSLLETNKSKLCNLFTYLLQFINNLATDIKTSKEIIKCFQFLNYMSPFLYDLAQVNPKDAHNSMLEILKEKHMNYQKKRKKFPQLDTLIYFKIIALLFPTSDFRHQVVTPTIIFMDQLLTRCKVKTRIDVSFGLFVTTLLLEYVSLSKRFLPSVINFLRGIIHLAVPKTTIRAIPTVPPFKSFNSLLVLPEKNNNGFSVELLMRLEDFIEDTVDNNCKIRFFYTALKLSIAFYNLYESLPSSVEIFDPILNLLELIPIDNYPQKVISAYEDLKDDIIKGKINKKMIYLVMPAKKPKALRLYEPNIQQVFENRKHRNIPKERAEHEKLLYKLKKEKKGALREIRRDNAFLSKLKLKKQLKSDMERKQKVKEIISGASVQQSELNALDRKRKKK